MAQVTELPDGRFRVRASIGSGPTRQRLSRTAKNKTELRRVLKEVERDLEQTGSLEPSKYTVATYLAFYIEHIRSDPKRSRKAIACTEARFDTLPDGVKATRIRKLKPFAVQKWLDGLRKDHADSTVAKYRADLRSAFERAVEWRLIPENPVSRTKRVEYNDKPDLDIPDEDALAALIDGLRETRYWAPATVAAFTGLRRGHLLALRWRDIDIAGRLILVRKRIDEEVGMPAVLKDADSSVKKAPRVIEIDDQCVAVLDAHKKAQAKERLAAKVWRDHGLVFPDKRGDVWRPGAFSVSWGRLMAEHETPLRFHDLRHAHGTLLLRAGVPINAVRKRLGHANLATTQRYVHVLEDADRAASDALAKRLRVTV